MKILEEQPRLSASDLANHLGCRHLTTLELASARRELTPPRWQDPALAVLQERGLEHEQLYLAHLRGRGLSVVEITQEGSGAAYQATVRAMHDGVDIIAQATLKSANWFGRADFLQRVSTDSGLGNWSYEVVDTKLARETRAGTILQLCLYSDLVGEVQQALPEFMYVVSPGNEFKPETFRVNDYLAYYRLVRGQLTGAVTADLDKEPSTYPEPVPKCDICRWWPMCDERRRKDDHLSLVAGISRLQRQELGSWGVETLEELARLPMPLERRPSRGSVETYERVREQARVQLEARQKNTPVYELLPREPERGLVRLPAPSPGDIFFDIEGDRFVGTGGLEYLLGWMVLDERAAPEYHALWAVNGREERTSFEAFVDMVMARWADYPDLHIYHYAPYEPSAMKRLMGRYATRGEEIDRMLRAGLFVDLYSVTKQAVRAGVEHYSIKDLEQFYHYERDIELRDASRNLHAFERALELGQVDTVPADVHIAVQAYNRDDCLSTQSLRNWLEGLRTQLIRAGEDLPRPDPGDSASSEALEEWEQRVRGLMDELLANVAPVREERSEEDQARWLLAHMQEWHRRESKAAYWEKFRLAELSDEELLYEKAGVAGLAYVEHTGGTAACPIHRYSFPVQDIDIRRGKDLLSGDIKIGSVDGIDVHLRTIDIKKTKASANSHPSALFTHEHIRTNALSDSLFRLGEWVVAHGVDVPGQHRAARDLLLQRCPRLRNQQPIGLPIQQEGESTEMAARRLCMELEGGVLPIQGPPGAGKTYTGARMICDLVRAGKKVGITAVSHKVIRNLLDEVVEAAATEGIPVRCIQKGRNTTPATPGQPIRETKKNADVIDALQDGSVQVAAGTAWLWAREELFQSLDVLFVDEAGQMSLSNVLAVAQAAQNVVLLGDPQQLEQPLQGSHPEGTEVSALEHLLGDGDHNTIPADRGLFLAETWRLHPSICAFTSELFYESRLHSRPDLANQVLVGSTRFAGAGLWFVPVEHQGNQNSSPEEVERVTEIYTELLTNSLSWINREGQEAPLTENDILIVAPYNAHVSALSDLLPSARIGTVDKFQGQEAPVVIYSMATSSPEEAPRGMEFLFSLNRLNVATSRARCVCILVANPSLFEPECRTPRQIQLANAFCRYVELAGQVTPSSGLSAMSGSKHNPLLEKQLSR